MVGLYPEWGRSVLPESVEGRGSRLPQFVLGLFAVALGWLGYSQGFGVVCWFIASGGALLAVFPMVHWIKRWRRRGSRG